MKDLKDYLFYQDDWATIYCGDCRDILPMFEPVDLVLTDPPYGIGFDYGTGYKDSPRGYIDFLWPVLEVCESKIIHGGLGVFQAAKNCRKWAEWFPREWRLIAIGKLFAQWMPNFMQYRTDYILFWEVGDGLKKHDTKEIPRDFFVSSQCANTSPGARPNHPCPRPIDTMKFCVDILSLPQQTILDPFMGSGTTLVAAKNLNRKSIGIEIEPKYCEIAVKRLRQEVFDFRKRE
jgi:site-specific DNA-methyltransferase (adenine-specific)